MPSLIANLSCALINAVFLLCSLDPNVNIFVGSSATNNNDSNADDATLVCNLLAALLDESLRTPNLPFLFLPLLVV